MIANADDAVVDVDVATKREERNRSRGVRKDINNDLPSAAAPFQGAEGTLLGRDVKSRSGSSCIQTVGGKVDVSHDRLLYQPLVP